MRSSSTKSGSAFPETSTNKKGENNMRKNSIKLAAAVLALTLAIAPTTAFAEARTRGGEGVIASISAVVKRALEKIGVVIGLDEVERPVKPVPTSGS
jgi:hypothetical protein